VLGSEPPINLNPEGDIKDGPLSNTVCATLVHDIIYALHHVRSKVIGPIKHSSIVVFSNGFVYGPCSMIKIVTAVSFEAHHCWRKMWLVNGESMDGYI